MCGMSGEGLACPSQRLQADAQAGLALAAVDNGLGTGRTPASTAPPSSSRRQRVLGTRSSRASDVTAFVSPKTDTSLPSRNRRKTCSNVRLARSCGQCDTRGSKWRSMSALTSVADRIRATVSRKVLGREQTFTASRRLAITFSMAGDGALNSTRWMRRVWIASLRIAPLRQTWRNM